MNTAPTTWPTDHVEFILVCHEGDSFAFYRAPVDAGVQELLDEMLQKTLSAFNATETPDYELAERYDTKAPLKASLQRSELEFLKKIADFDPGAIDSSAIESFHKIAFYLVRFVDFDGNRLVAARRASYFKAMLKQRSRLIRFVDDTLTAVGDQIFKLDWDFDFVMTATDVYILRPGNFEIIAGVDDAIAEKIPEKAQDLQQRMSFINFAPIADLAATRKRIARLLSSVASRTDLESIDKNLLLAQATKTGVELEFLNGRYTPTATSIRGLLEILDRRRYHISLRTESHEAFVASSRQALGPSVKE